MLVTVIVPVYNSERFLCQCIESVLGQAYQNLNLILVDDGSTDKSGAICDDYARKDHRITVIHQSNAGPGTARNMGLSRIAPNGYTMFLDADDYLSPDALNKCVNSIEKHHADMVICNFTGVLEETGKFVRNAMEATGLLSLNDIILYIDGTQDLRKSGFIGPAWRRLLKSNIILDNHLRFPDGLYLAEDIVFMANYFVKCNSIYALDEPLYFKRQHDCNLSFGYANLPVEAMLCGFDAYKIILEHASKEDNRKLDNQLVDNMIGSIVRLYHPRLNFSDDEKSQKISYILRNSEFIRALKGYRVKRGHSRMLALSIRLRYVPFVKMIAKFRAKKRYRDE